MANDEDLHKAIIAPWSSTKTIRQRLACLLSVCRVYRDAAISRRLVADAFHCGDQAQLVFFDAHNRNDSVKHFSITQSMALPCRKLTPERWGAAHAMPGFGSVRGRQSERLHNANNAKREGGGRALDPR